MVPNLSDPLLRCTYPLRCSPSHVLILIEWISLARLPFESEYNEFIIIKRRLGPSNCIRNATINDEQIDNVHNIHIGLRSKLE